MKAEISLPEKEAISFPVFVKCRVDGSIYRFISLVEGVQVLTNSGESLLRSQSNYRRITDSEVWEILPRGTKITFTQE